MKKVLFLMFVSLLVLGACGQDGDKSNKADNKQSEHKKSNDPKKNKDEKSDSKKDSKNNSSEDKQQANSDSNDTSSNESQSTSKNIMAKRKITMATMNAYRVKTLLNNKITSNNLMIIKQNNKTLTLLVIKNI